MKKGINLMVALIMAILFNSCTDDNDVKNTYRQLSVMSITGDYYLFTTDANESLIATEIPEGYDFEEDKRVMVTFDDYQPIQSNGLYDYQINVTNIQNIQTKDVIEINEVNKDTLGVEGLYIDQMSLGNKYLNVSSTFYASGEKPHYLSLSIDMDDQPDDQSEIALVLHHKSKDDIGNANTPYKSFISYDLRSLNRSLTPPYTLVIHYKDIQKNNKEHRIEVKE